MNKENVDQADLPSNKGKKPSLFRNFISFAGFVVVVASLTSIVLLFLLEMIEMSGGHDNPYTVLVTYILLPSVLVFGIFIVLLGAFLERRRRRRDPDSGITPYPVIDLNDPLRRRKLMVLLAGIFLFLFISAFGSYRAFEYTESVSFCGQQCHTVMNPEFVAFQAAPHSSIRCVDCHVGGGPEWYVRSKFNGMRQLYAVAFGTYSKPIETPVHNMRTANETCAACHRSEKYHGDVLKTFNHYGYDEGNTLRQIRMLIKVGGGNPETGPADGIHWHMNLANEITFVSTDEKRQNIPWVRMKNANGEVTEYFSRNANFSQSQVDSSEKRRMDCIDCHNRPAHRYLSPNNAVDQAIASAKIDQSLPFIKAKSVEVLSKPYTSTQEAVTTIAVDLTNYYSANHPDIIASKRVSVDAAVAEVQRIYQTYFFPEMNTNWSSHIDNIGHYNAQGCFRCHDGQHVSKEGKVIRNDCAICHTTLDQTFGDKKLVPTDGRFQHPVNLGDRNTWQCAACHKGDRSFQHPLNLGDISRYSCAECHKGEQYKTVN